MREGEAAPPVGGPSGRSEGLGSLDTPSRSPGAGLGFRGHWPRALLWIGGIEAIALIWLAWLPGHGLPHPAFALWAIAFAAYLLAAGVTRLLPGADLRSSRRASYVIWGWAVVMRIALVAVPPDLSDDVYRYMWDGHVQVEGTNPYRYAPEDPAVVGLRTDYADLINNPSVPTIYPPAAQVAFAGAAAAGAGPRMFGLIWTLFDLAAGLLLWKAAARLGRRRALVLSLYLWCPLLIVETAWNAHLEALGLCALAWLLAAAADGRALRAGVALGAAGMVKFAPLLLIPAATGRLGRRVALAAVGTTALLALPYLGAGERLWTGLGTYARHWRAHEGAFLILEWLFPDPVHARAAVLGVVLVSVGWATWRRLPLDRVMLVVFGTALVVSPTFHPWYALWVLPAAALTSSPPWIALQGVAFLGYWGLPSYLATGVWPQPAWIRAGIWVPVLGLVLWSWFRSGAAPSRGAEPSHR